MCTQLITFETIIFSRCAALFNFHSRNGKKKIINPLKKDFPVPRWLVIIQQTDKKTVNRDLLLFKLIPGFNSFFF